MTENVMPNELDYGPFGGLRATFKSADSVPRLLRLKDGVYKVHAPGGYIHFLVQRGLSDNTFDGVITMMFHGDLSKRTDISPPFFAGRGVQAALDGGPIVCFSDPIVEMDSECTIGWFAGSTRLDVPHVISAVIESLTAMDSRPVWLVGGSGGGFASINIACLVNRQVSVAVWNPQCAIERYNPSHVTNYLRCAFPEIYDSDTDRSLADVCRSISSVTGREFDLVSGISRGSVPEQVLILQNYDDWHVIPHAAPLIETLDMAQRSPGIFSDPSGSKVGWFTELGTGHAAPETAQLVKLLKAVYSAPEADLADTICRLDAAELFSAATYKFRPLDYRRHGDDLGRLLNLELEQNRAIVVSDYIVEGQHRLTYRFSLYRHGARIGQSEWKSRMDWPMYRENAHSPGDVVEVEVRDGFGHTVTSIRTVAPEAPTAS